MKWLHTQGEDPSYMWVLIVLGYWLRLVLGIISVLLSSAWLLQVLLYILLSPPLYPFLNIVFKVLDGVFPLFGTAAFSVFCFYLLGTCFSFHYRAQMPYCASCGSTGICPNLFFNRVFAAFDNVHYICNLQFLVQLQRLPSTAHAKWGLICWYSRFTRWN